MTTSGSTTGMVDACYTIVTALALLLGANASDDPTVTLSGVLVLTPDNFDQHVNGGKHVLLELYAPGCDHCKQMYLQLQMLGAKIASDPKLASHVVVATVDADKHRSLGDRLGVKTFPTVLYLARGKPVDKHEIYQGPPSYDGFLSFLENALEGDNSFAHTTSLDALATKEYEWLAEFLEKMWPYVTKAVDKEAMVQLPGLLLEAPKPALLSRIDLQKFFLGDKPPKLAEIRVIQDPKARGQQGDESIHLKMDLEWVSSQNIELDVTPGGGFLGEMLNGRFNVNNLKMFGKLMLSFRPLMYEFPIVSGLQVCFTEPPSFDFDYRAPFPIEVCADVEGFVNKFINEHLLTPYLCPDHYSYPVLELGGNENAGKEFQDDGGEHLKEDAAQHDEL